MKQTLILLSYACCLLPLALPASVPLSWTVDMKRAQPATFEAYQGEVIAIEAALHADGKPFEAPSNYSLFWQTNGMGRIYWEAPCSRGSDIPVAATNVLFATWLPSYDVGAKVYNCFIGSPSNNYHTAFQLRLRPSPGATPNVLPLPVPVIDFAKVRVLNPPWPTGGTDTNAVIDIIHETVSGAARPLPKYLHTYDADDSYPDAAQEYYRSRGNGKTDGGCSSVRDGGFLYRNFDYPFDDRAEFVVHMSSGSARFASVGVAQVGTNLTEAIVTSGKPSRCYKWLPGATVDGINENGVACNINVVDGDPQWGGGVSPALHPLAAVRWILDNATNAQHAATYIASHIAFPPGWAQNFHYMVADESATYIVENGTAYQVTNGVPAMTNFRLYGDPKDTTGEGQERYIALTNGANITSQWWTLTYTPTGYRPSDLPGITDQDLANLFNYWENNPRESHRGEAFGDVSWWQTVHTSIYDITNRVLRVAVQETDDWYTFQMPASSAKIDAYTKSETDAKLASKANESDLTTHTSDINNPHQVTAAQVGALPSSTTHLSGDVPTSRTVNGYELSDDVNLSAYDVGAYPVFGWLSMFGDDYIGYELRIMKPNGNRENVVMSAGQTFAKIEGGTGGYFGEFHLGNDGLSFSDPFSGGVSIIPGAINRIVGGSTYIYFMPLASGTLALETWQSLSAMIDNATNQAARTSVGTKMMTLIDQPVQQKINNAVNANLNTYIDGETGVEYIGKFYGGSLYYVPTGNVYPPNN